MGKNNIMRIAYADPPYIGCGKYYKEKQEIDHLELINKLVQHDAWALSCHTPSLGYLLNLCPKGTRVGAWVKPFCSFKPNVNPAYAWEPVLFISLPRARDVATVRDWCAANITLKKGLVGAKPPQFCFWLFDLLGAQSDDEFNDLFPGTGIVTQCWQSWVDRSKQTQIQMVFRG